MAANERVRVTPAGEARKQAAPTVSVATIRAFVAKDQHIGVQNDNPKRGESMTRYDKYKWARFVSEYLELRRSVQTYASTFSADMYGR